jgi:hypothetical protein
VHFDDQYFTRYQCLHETTGMVGTVMLKMGNTVKKGAIVIL